MLVGPPWFGEHSGMFLMALAADQAFAKRLWPASSRQTNNLRLERSG